MNGYMVLKGQLRNNGVRYKQGDVIGAELLDSKECEILISRSIISPVLLTKEATIDVVDKTSPPIKRNGEEEPLDVILNLNFESDELKAGAKEQGLEWKGNISKPNLIKLIIENNKQNYFLELLEDDENE